MKRRAIKFWIVPLLLAGVVAGFAACAPLPPPNAEVVYVRVGPPPPRVEVIGVSPGRAFVRQA